MWGHTFEDFYPVTQAFRDEWEANGGVLELLEEQAQESSSTATFAFAAFAGAAAAFGLVMARK